MPSNSSNARRSARYFSGQYPTRNIPNLRGGLNDSNDQQEIQDDEMVDLENVEVDDQNIKSAAGYVDYGGSSVDGPYWGGFNAIFSSGTNRMIRQRGATLEYDNGSGTWTGCTMPTAGSPATAVSLTQIPCSFEMLNDIILWSNGTDNCVSSTDGITWTTRSTLPKSKQLFNNGLNRILFLAQPSAPARIDWSDINDPLTVNALSFEFIGKNDGQSVERAVLTPDGGMLCFKTNRFYSISDITAGIIAVDPLGIAPCYGGTVQATENSVIWFGGDSIYEYSGGQVKKISSNISFSGRANITSGYLATATYFNKKYRLSIPATTRAYNFQEYVVNRKVMTGKSENPYVITRNGRTIGCYILEQRDVSNVKRNRLYIGSSLTGSAYRIFAYINDLHDTSVTQGLNGAAQSCYFITKFYTEQTPFHLKRYTKSFIDALVTNTFNITLSYRFDPNGAWTDVTSSFTATTLNWVFGDGTTGTFSEGFGFLSAGSAQLFTALERADNIRGIQFKFAWSSITDVVILSLAYKFLRHNKFR